MLHYGSQLISRWLPLVSIFLAAMPLGARAAQSPLSELENTSYWYNLCQLHVEAENYAAARPACEQTLALDPGHLQAWIAYSDVLWHLEEHTETVAATREAIAIAPNQSAAYVYQCMAWAEMSQAERALEACNQALQIDENWGQYSPAQAHLYRGRALTLLQDYEGALAANERILQLSPGDSQALTYRCQIFLDWAKYDQAAEQCQAALEGNGRWGTASPALAYYYQGIAYRQQERLVDAIAAFDQAMGLEADDSRIWIEQAVALERLGRPQEALLAYTRAVDLQPQSSRALVGRCAMLNQTGDYAAALAACEQAMTADRNWGPLGLPRAWSEKAQALTGQGQYEAALAAVNRAVGMAPEFSEAWNNRGVVLWYLQDFPGAIASLQRSAEINPDSPFPYANLGRMLRSLGQFQPALEAYDEALRLDPTDSTIWANRSVVLWALDRHPEALESANRTISLEPNSYLGWLNKAAALAALNRNSEALTAYQQALRVNPNSAEAWTGAGVVLSRLNRYDQAQNALARALEINPQQPVARTVLQQLSGASATPAVGL